MRLSIRLEWHGQTPYLVSLATNQSKITGEPMKSFRHCVVSFVLAATFCIPVSAGEMDFPFGPPTPKSSETWTPEPDEPPTSEPPSTATLTESIDEIGMSVCQAVLSIF